jgi:uncharacterized protein
MMSARMFLYALLLSVVLVGMVTAAKPESDPIGQDPPIADPHYPPSSAELKIPSGGTRVNGILYRAQGKQLHPLVVLLHGFPGNERNLDLAQALRRDGYDVLYFNYRGSWGSGGNFSFESARQDVANVLKFVRNESTADKYGIDAQRIVLIGHSMGGWLALAGTADDAQVQCTVALAPWNIGHFGSEVAQSGRVSAGFLDEARSYTDPEAGPLKGVTAEQLADEAKAHAAAWDFSAFAPALANRKGLVIASAQDEAHSKDMLREPLFTALKAAGAKHWDSRAIDDDHGTSGHRIALEKMVIDWLGQQDCKASAGKPAS